MITEKSEKEWYMETTARNTEKVQTITEWMNEKDVTIEELSTFLDKTKEETKELINNPFNGKVNDVLALCHALDIKLEEIKYN